MMMNYQIFLKNYDFTSSFLDRKAEGISYQKLSLKGGFGSWPDCVETQF